jgi:predicted nucleotidyltransferase
MGKAVQLEIPAEQLTDFCRRNQVQELALFGSAASGAIGPESDIDLLVTFLPETRVGFLTLARMQRELGDLLGRKVDLVPKGGLKPVIRDSVLASARVLYRATNQIPLG